MPDLRLLKRCFDVSGLLGFDTVSSSVEYETRGLTDSLVNQLLHNYFIICNMFRPQLFGQHQGESFS
jgi:hypothetical protein